MARRTVVAARTSDEVSDETKVENMMKVSVQ
jgi:hypothetical protein